MNERIENELTKLEIFQRLCKDAIIEYGKNHPYILTSYESTELFRLLDRMFGGEMDYLHNNSESYFDLYDEGE